MPSINHTSFSVFYNWPRGEYTIQRHGRHTQRRYRVERMSATTRRMLNAFMAREWETDYKSDTWHHVSNVKWETDPRDDVRVIQLAKWVRSHGFDVHVTRTGNVRVSKSARAVTRHEVQEACYFNDTVLMTQRGDVVFIKTALMFGGAK